MVKAQVIHLLVNTQMGMQAADSPRSPPPPLPACYQSIQERGAGTHWKKKYTALRPPSDKAAVSGYPPPPFPSPLRLGQCEQCGCLYANKASATENSEPRCHGEQLGSTRQSAHPPALPPYIPPFSTPTPHTHSPLTVSQGA